MSKASEYASLMGAFKETLKSLKEPEQPKFWLAHAGGGRAVAWVADGGYLDIERIRLDHAEALLFAHWILATFGEADGEGTC